MGEACLAVRILEEEKPNVSLEDLYKVAAEDSEYQLILKALKGGK